MNELTPGEGFGEAVALESLLAISHKADSISVAYSRSPSAKLPICSPTLARVASVIVPSLHMNASRSAYKSAISLYLSPPLARNRPL